MFWKELDENNELIVKDEYEVIKGIYKNDDKSYTIIEDEINEPDEQEEISLDVTGENLGYPNPFSKD